MPEPIVQPLANAPQEPVVQPTAPQASEGPPAPADPATTAEQAGQTLPDEILQIPVMMALLQGSPAAVSMPLEGAEKRPEVAAIIKNKDAVFAAGLNTYRSLSGDVGVLFNQMFVSPEEVMAADKAGQLQELAPSFDAVNEAVASAPLDAHPSMMPPRHTEAPAQAPVPTPPSFNKQTMPAAGQEKILKARLKNMQPGPPSSGASPGAGRLLNNITKPVL